MFFQVIEIHRNKKTYRYLRLLKTYRQGTRVKQQTMANLGNFDDMSLKKIGTLIQSLFKVWRHKFETNKERGCQFPPVIPFKLREEEESTMTPEEVAPRKETCSISSNAIW